MARSDRTTSRVAQTLIAALAIAGISLSQPTNASAQADPSASLGTRSSVLAAASWVGADGLIYTVTDYVDADAPVSSLPPRHLVIRRTFTDGTGDPTWGTYDGVDGLREIEVAGTLTEGLRNSTAVVAVADDGTVGLGWLDYCSTGPCTRSYVRITADGTVVSPAVYAQAIETTGLPLPNATFLNPNGNGSTYWRDSDGSELDLLPISSSDIVDATVDSSGRLLVTTTAGRLVRWPAGSAADLDLAITGCADDTSVRLGRSATADTFATICQPTESAPMSVQRRSAVGSVEWTATPYPDDPDGVADFTTAAFVDATDRVWVGAGGPTVPQTANGDRTFVQVFTSGGPGPLTYQRRSPNFGSHESPHSRRVADLRAGPGDTVLVTDTFDCCFGNGYQTIEDSVITALAPPETEAPPRCAPSDVAIDPTDGTSASVTFTGCDAESIAYRQPTAYDVVVTSSDGTTDTEVVAATTPGASYQLTVPATAGELTEVAVTASNGAGPNPDEQDTLTADTVTPFPTVEAFVQRQLTDLRGTAPTNVAVNEVAAAIRSGTSPLDVIDAELETGRAGQVVEPVARLYRAYFLRLPDPSGLAYWVAKRDAGRGLHTISESFARSPEFQAYGTLTNRQYVNALYQNIFGRPSDPQGLAYWTNKLDTRKTSRGKVVLQFSESAEGKTLLAPYVEPLATTWLMLDRVPTPTEATTWATTTNPHRDVAATILATPEYATTTN